MARRRFFVDSIQQGQAEISGDEAHHLTRVLRVAQGQKYEISDNRHAYLAEIVSTRKDLVCFTVLETIVDPPPALRTTLLAALIKFDRFEAILEKATELGVERVIPVEAERSEKGLAEAARKRRDRWVRVAREASEQSRRSKLPAIDLPMPLEQAARTAGTYRYLLDEGDAPPLLGAVPKQGHPEDEVLLLLGPEGGWTDRERQAAKAQEWQAVSLGFNILRAETAAIAAIAVVNAAWQLREERGFR